MLGGIVPSAIPRFEADLIEEYSSASNDMLFLLAMFGRGDNYPVWASRLKDSDHRKLHSPQGDATRIFDQGLIGHHQVDQLIGGLEQKLIYGRRSISQDGVSKPWCASILQNQLCCLTLHTDRPTLRYIRHTRSSDKLSDKPGSLSFLIATPWRSFKVVRCTP